MNILPSLDQIAIKHGTDKSSLHHGYTRWYEMFFEPMRNERITLFEAGWGGYQYPDRGGEGAKTWREYFPNAIIVSIDIHPKVHIPEGIEFHQGSQDDPQLWRSLVNKYGNPDIFICDASHINSLEVATFRIIMPILNPKGYFVAEDCHTSYWSEVASDGTDFKGGLNRPGTVVENAKEMIDQVMSESDVGNWYGVESIHVFDKIIFYKKK